MTPTLLRRIMTLAALLCLALFAAPAHAQAPTITSFSPTSGPVGTSVVITGTNFTGTTVVGFQNKHATSFTVNSSTQITTSVPSGAATGPVAVATPGGTAHSSGNFIVTVAAPTITSFTPTSGPIGTSVTITGTGFTGASAVTFNGTTASTYTVNSATQITATVPTGATTGTISVTTPGGTATSSTSFTVIVPAPTITSFSPTSGPVGTVVTVTGTNLNGVTAVRFHNANATVFSANAAGTQMTVTVPAGAATGTFTITTPGGAIQTTGTFTVIPAPTVTSFTPTSGPVGTVVTVTGTNFTGTTNVRFHNANAVTFSVNADGTQITVTVPSGAATGTFTVTTPGGSIQTTGTFTVIAQPVTLTSLSLAQSTLQAGTPGSGTIGLSGSASANVVISLTSSDASVIVPSSVTVPAGQASASFSVTSNAVDQTQATISASYNGVTDTAQLSIVPSIALTAIATSSSKITLYWTGVSGAIGYNIYRCLSATGTYTKLNSSPYDTADNGIGVTNMFMYSDSGLTSGTEYFYYVAAVNSGGTQGLESNTDSAAPDTSAIAWDTENAATIVSQVQAMVANNLSGDETAVGALVIAGPDGVMYQLFQDGNPAQANASPAYFDSNSHTTIYADGNQIPAPIDTTLSNPPGMLDTGTKMITEQRIGSLVGSSLYTSAEHSISTDKSSNRYLSRGENRARLSEHDVLRGSTKSTQFIFDER